MYVVLPPAKTAPTLFEPFMVRVHEVEVNAEQSPVHLVKSALLPEAGIALNVTVVFAVTLAEQPEPPAAVQWMPAAPSAPTT